MKNITLSADEAVIEAAREVARRRKTTLNVEFREWLRRYASSDTPAQDRVSQYRRLMASLSNVSTRGRRFTREDMNER